LTVMEYKKMEQQEYQIKEKELIDSLLVLNRHQQSTIQLALENANLNQGIGNDFVNLLLHLIALEQIGNLFCESDSETNGIVKAIKTFSSVKFSKRALQGIKHLRHSLAHNYGLAIIDSYESKATRNYKFLLHHFENTTCSEDDAKCYIITPEPKHEWNGKLANSDYYHAYGCKMDAQTSFRIFVPSLIRLADRIIKEILPMKHRVGELHFVRDNKSKNMSDEEFFGQIAYKYFIYH